MISATLANRIAETADKLERLIMEGREAAAEHELARLEILVRQLREQREVDYDDAKKLGRVTEEKSE